MPTIKNIPGQYRFYFCSFDCNEPEHVHAQREMNTCKFWLKPVCLCNNHGFSPKELNIIQKIINEKKKIILEAWDEHCGKYSRG